MSQNEAPIFTIKRTDFTKLSTVDGLENYIKWRQPLVSSVFSSSIYFVDHMNYIGWDNSYVSDEMADMFLRAINAACNTNIQFDDEKMPGYMDSISSSKSLMLTHKS